MRLITLLASGCAAAALISGSAVAQTAAPAEATAEASPSDIVVTARQREERLKDVPIAVSAISGDTIKEQQLVTVKDVAAYVPGLNINSDSVGRAFVSIRGVGTTLIDTVQPGVGIFIDGIYQPNTTYLNSPLVDVARVEVLRGPQGTLFGNNTLGGAINVITRQPSNTFQGRIDGSLATGDNFESVSASLSGPIVRDLLQVRVGAAYHQQDGFQFNTLAGGDQNPLETKSVNGTIRFLPASWATITANGGYDRVFGGSVPYFTATGPNDHTLNGQTNKLSLATIDYYAANLKGEFDVSSINTKVTAIGAYNQSNTTSAADGDFSPIDFLRATNDRKLKTRTAELRLDTKWNDSISTLVGAFYSHSTTDQVTTATLVPLNLTIPSTGHTENRSFALFGTAFLRFDPTLDLTVGLRFDHQKLDATTSTALATYKADEFEPRVTLTKKWTPEIMTYASVARGVRGGGQNEPNAPNVVFRGDNVWTYEVGAKTSAMGGRLSLDVAAFYNSYNHFIGPNALAPSTRGPGFVAINLNAGHVESYGFEAEASARITDWWRVFGNLTLLHARVTDSREFKATTGYDYPGNRILFVPDVNFTVGTNFRFPFHDDQAIVLDGNAIYKGKRTGGSLDAASVPILKAYTLANASIGWQTPHFELALFATNLFNEKYDETYLDKSLLARAGVPPFLINNLAIQGARRRVGLRGTVRF